MSLLEVTRRRTRFIEQRLEFRVVARVVFSDGLNRVVKVRTLTDKINIRSFLLFCNNQSVQINDALITPSNIYYFLVERHFYCVYYYIYLLLDITTVLLSSEVFLPIYKMFLTCLIKIVLGKIEISAI